MSDLRAQLAAAIKKVEKGVHSSIGDVADIMGTNLPEESYHDTGLHAANWVPSVNVEAASDLEYDAFGIDADNVIHGEHNRIISEAEAKQVATSIPEFKTGDTIYWSNSVPYLEVPSIDAFGTASAATQETIAEANAKVGK